MEIETSPSDEQRGKQPNATPTEQAFAPGSTLNLDGPQLIENTNWVGQNQLDPCSVDEGIKLFREEISGYTPGTQANYASVLRYLSNWCLVEEIENLNDLTARQLLEYRTWRQHDATPKGRSLKKSSLKSQMDKVRVFVRFCERINVVRPGLHQAITAIRLTDGEGVRRTILSSKRASEILGYQSTHVRCSRDHVTWVLLTATGARVGGIHSLDVEDVIHVDERPALRFRHRPDSDTRLKNGNKSERVVGISEETLAVIEEYIEQVRRDTTDAHGRNPLLSSKAGRLSKSTTRKYVYKWTRPCAIGQPCPHGRTREDCIATKSGSESLCPSSQSAHTIRKGYLTHQLNSLIDPVHLTGRCDVSIEVLRKHYDMRTEQEEMIVRRRAFDEARRRTPDFGGE